MDFFSLQGVWLVIVALLVLVLPGAALGLLVGWALDRGSEDAEKREGLSAALLLGIGLSVAFWPLMLLYISLVGLHFSPGALWGVLAISAVVIAWMVAMRWRSVVVTREGLVVGLVLVGMTLLALIFRLGDIQGLAVPLFGDSLHHTMITTIIINTGQVPRGYQPYVPVDTFTYHFGFHTLAATLAELTTISAEQAVLVMGQVLNVMALPVAYLLGRKLFGSPLAGLGGSLITGFLSAMPAYYVNWGRYTQLAGQILLPVALVTFVSLMRGKSTRSEWLLAAFCVAGLVVVHYRILIFYGLFVIAFFAWDVITSWGDQRALLMRWSRAAGAVLLGMLATLPWIVNLATNYLPGLRNRLSSVTTEYISSYTSAENLRMYVGVGLAAVGLVGLAIALAERKIAEWGVRSAEYTNPNSSRHWSLVTGHWPLVVATWAGLMLLSIWVVPGAIGSYTVAIILYIPLSALGGYGMAWIAGVLSSRLSVPAWGFAVLMLLAAPVLAIVFNTRHVVDEGHFSYVHQADLQAMDWVKRNTPQDAKFLVGSLFSYAGRAVTAEDAGMWLPLLAGRNVSVPALASWTERPIDPQFFTDTRKLAAYSQPASDPNVQRLAAQGTISAPVGPSDPAMLALMQKMGITYVYQGAPGGNSKQRLDIADMLKDSCHYQPVYPPASGVYILKVNYSCP